MSVTLNEGALQLLLESQQGPVAAEITRRAENVVELAQQNVREIMHRSPQGGAVVNAVDFALDEKLQAFIGIEDEGSQTRYLAQKAVNPKEGTQSWLLTAFTQGWNL